MIHKTANGKYLDMSQLIIQNEREIAVGNAKVNARGDILGEGGKVIHSRDDVSKAFYNKKRGSQLTNLPSHPQDQSNDIFAVQADEIVDTSNAGFDEADTVVPEMPGLPDPQTEALAKSQALAERLKQQRKLQQDG